VITVLEEGRRADMRANDWPAPLHMLPSVPAALGFLSPSDLLSNGRVARSAARFAAQDFAALDEADALGWLREHGVSERAIEWFWATVARSLLNVPLQRCSAAALARVAHLMLSCSGYHFGFARVGLSDLFVPGCVQAVEAAGGSVLSGARVVGMQVEGERFRSFELAGGQRLRARAAVLALPPDAFAGVAPPQWRDGVPQAAATLEPCPYVSTYLWFDRRLGPDRFWARVWRSGDLNTDFHDLANIRGWPAEAPSLIASNAIHVHGALSDDEVIERTHREIAAFAPAAADARVRHAAVHRVPMAIPCPLPGAERARAKTDTPFENLWLAGDWTRTGLPASMESAARSGALAAERVAAAFGRAAVFAEPLPKADGLMAWAARARAA
jgi:phytoene dehydrogenase-like protein